MEFRERSALRCVFVSHRPEDQARMGAGEGGMSRPRPAPEAQLHLGREGEDTPVHGDTEAEREGPQCWMSQSTRNEKGEEPMFSIL